MFAFALIPLTALLAASPLTVQQGSWLAWQGCWRATGDDAPDRVVCLLPGANAAEVRLNVVAGGAVAERAVLRTDGVSYPIEEGGCTGVEKGTWSLDGRRVFLRADLDCEGVRRVSASVLAMVNASEWVDVQTVTVAGQPATRTIRYRAIPATNMPVDIAAALDDGRDLARESARLQTSGLLEIADVVEATSHLPAPGVEALVAARNAGFGLDAKKLVQLAEARVPGSVIDVMVALSYPKSFVIASNGVSERGPARAVGTLDRVGYGRWASSSCYDPYWDARGSYDSPYSGFGSSCYDRYRYGYGWNSRYGYDLRSGYYGWVDTQRVVVIVRPDDLESFPTSGAVVKGAGYTRGTGTTTGAAQPRSSSGTGSGSSGASSAGSSSGTTSTPATSSGSSSSTGRTAIPRGSGGGGGGGS